MTTKADREAVLTELYKSMFPSVAKFIAKMGGSFDDAKDVFHDALIIYYERVIAGSTTVANHRAYITGIAKHLWHKKFKAGISTRSIDDMRFDLADEVEQHPSGGKLIDYLQAAGRRCMELLSAFYYDKLSMKEVAGKFGYAGERSVTVQKYKCLEKVRETVKQQSLEYADFIE